jgi:hypothetical protein
MCDSIKRSIFLDYLSDGFSIRALFRGGSYDTLLLNVTFGIKIKINLNTRPV